MAGPVKGEVLNELEEALIHPITISKSTINKIGQPTRLNLVIVRYSNGGLNTEPFDYQTIKSS